MIAYNASSPTLAQALPANDTYQDAVQIIGTGASVRATPGSGGAVTVQYTYSSLASIQAGTATWYTAPAFAGVSVVAEDTLRYRVTAIRAKQTGGSAPGLMEVCQ